MRCSREDVLSMAVLTSSTHLLNNGCISSAMEVAEACPGGACMGRMQSAVAAKPSALAHRHLRKGHLTHQQGRQARLQRTSTCLHRLQVQELLPLTGQHPTCLRCCREDVLSMAVLNSSTHLLNACISRLRPILGESAWAGCSLQWLQQHQLSPTGTFEKAISLISRAGRPICWSAQVQELRPLTGQRPTCLRCCREDVLSMAVLNSSTIATGDYEGRINFWNVHSGEKRMTLFHTANRFETAVEQLLFLQPLQTSGWPCLLSCGGERGLVPRKERLLFRPPLCHP